jgi:NADH-quinone oxidoreductase subunit F
MDIRLLLAVATDAEKAAVDDLLGQPASGWDGGTHVEEDGRIARRGHAARDLRHLLLPALQAVQTRAGWVSPGGLNYICERLTVPPADAYGVATFYGLLSVDEMPPRVLHVCDDVACRCHGAEELIAGLEEHFGSEHEEHEGATWLRSPCLGQCDKGTAGLFVEAGDEPVQRVLAPLTEAQAIATLRGQAPAEATLPSVPQRGEPGLRLLRRVGVVDPYSLHDYRAEGGYETLRRAIEMGPQAVLRELKDSGLVGRGGAAFPTGVKWEAVAQQPVQPHYLICNADESEPGTFKDRVILEGDPFSLIESMTIAAYVTNAEHGFIYLRGEYPEAHRALRSAIETARYHGYLGENILDHGFSFELEIRSGAGAYICGEETAIFNSIEGFRGEPRSKPPFPVAVGVFGKPTVVNNVETLVNILPVLAAGGPAYAESSLIYLTLALEPREIGTSRSTGPKLFCISGHVQAPGVYEVPFGETLGNLIERAGGLPEGRKLQAVLLGGAAGVFVGPDDLSLPLTLEDARAANATLGSGAIVVFDETVDMGTMLMRIAAFFRDESCGQCTPCRVGTVRQEEALARLVSGRTHGTLEDELALINEVGQCMRDSSICGLGQTAWSAIDSAISKLGTFDKQETVS